MTIKRILRQIIKKETLLTMLFMLGASYPFSVLAVEEDSGVENKTPPAASPSSQSQAEPSSTTTPAPTPTPTPTPTTKPSKTSAAKASSRPFKPSEEISEDFSVPFPIDI